MEQLLMYLLKMILCSAVLFGYYRIALYNERFHQWNRFYLVSAMLLSVIVPFIRIHVTPRVEENDLSTLIASLPWNGQKDISIRQGMNWQDITILLGVFVSVILLARVIIGITRIVIAYRANKEKIEHDNVELILTELAQAPFSFFSWLFWRKDIDPASANGQRMLNHELTHIYERHSIDKLFTSLLLCVFWMNPFFWLMRRELNMIHEFLADRKAVTSLDGSGLAEMILLALPFTGQINTSLINPFFSSQIKRRLLMISTSKQPKFNYLRRVSGLALMAVSVFALALSIGQAEGQKASGTKTLTDTIPGNKNADSLTEVRITAPQINITLTDTTRQPLYILDGNEIDPRRMKELDPNTIKAVHVFKDAEAIKKYGERGKYGVLNIYVQNAEPASAPKEKIILRTNDSTRLLYLLDKNEISKEAFDKLDPDNIESMNILKDVQPQGKKGKYTLVEIRLKKRMD